MTEESHTFHQKDPLAATYSRAIQGAGVGLFASALQNSLNKHEKGAMGIFTRTGSTIALFSGMAAIFTYVDQSLANYRQTEDAINGATAGCAAGFLVGLRSKSIPAAFGACAILGASAGTVDATGRHFAGDGRKALPREEREKLRLGAFKDRPLLESVNTEPLKRSGIEVA